METLEKPTLNTYPLADDIRNRWSPRAFADRPLASGILCSVLEAARWAPSSYNEQPWRFIVAVKDTDPAAFERLAGLLVDGNSWAKAAPVLLLSVAKLKFDHNQKPNRHAYHDVGLASDALVFQATALGLSAHMLAGFKVDEAYTALNIPEGFEPVAMMALGYRGETAQLSKELQDRETAARVRLSLQQIAFTASWGQPLPTCFT